MKADHSRGFSRLTARIAPLPQSRFLWRPRVVTHLQSLRCIVGKRPIFPKSLVGAIGPHKRTWEDAENVMSDGD
jgi:hypothetical protein